MEELRSTALIDSEILEDSRKKAERILAHSLRECENILASVDKKIDASAKEKKVFYDEKIALYKKEMFASLPLEQKRYLVQFEQLAMQEAITEYFSNLSHDKKLILLSNLLKKYKDYLIQYSLVIKVVGFNKEDILALVKKEYSSATIISCDDMDPVLCASIESKYDALEGMIIESEDRSRQCRLFLGELVEQIIDKNSYELATTLFCGGLPK